MYSSLDDVEFLVRSPSRVAVIDAIHEAPRTRDELKELADASRTTLSRMLADFEERGWIVRSDGRYEPTPEGAFVASEVTRLLGNMEAAEKLDGALRWLPVAEFDFDLNRLDDAEVITLRWNDPASMRVLARHLDGASRVQSITTAVSREVVDVLYEVTVGHEASYEGVLTTDAVRIVRNHPELRSQLREILESERTSLYQYHGDAPLAMVMVIDDQAAVCNHGSGGPQMEAVLTDDEAVRSWVESYFSSVRSDAESVNASAFAP